MDKSAKYSRILFRDISFVEKIGEGTFGQVYKAGYRDAQGKEHLIAIKKFRYFDKVTSGIHITTLRELRYLGQLDHPNVVKLLQVKLSRPCQSPGNMQRGNLYMLFPFIDNDLQGLLASSLTFTIPQVKCLFKQILQGLDYLHRQNIVHRDIKGANILVSNKG